MLKRNIAYQFRMWFEKGSVSVLKVFDPAPLQTDLAHPLEVPS